MEAQISNRPDRASGKNLLEQCVLLGPPWIIDKHGAVDSFKYEQAAGGGPDDPERRNQFLNILQTAGSSEHRHRQTSHVSDQRNKFKRISLHDSVAVDAINHHLARSEALHSGSEFRRRVAGDFGCIVRTQFEIPAACLLYIHDHYYTLTADLIS